MKSALLLGLLVAIGAARPTQIAPLQLGGVVLTAEKEPKPIGRAIVTITRLDNGLQRDWWAKTIADYPSTVTGEDGRFLFSNLRPGHYRVTAERPPFLKKEYGSPRPGVSGTPVELVSQSITTVTIQMTKGAVITGVVWDAAGAPAVDVPVSASSGGAAGPAINGAYSDDRGVYRLFGLPAGEYTVVAYPRSGLDTRASLEVMTDADVDAALAALRTQEATGATSRNVTTIPSPRTVSANAAVFYPGTASESDAIRLKVEAGSEIDGLDFSLGAFGGSGQVTGIIDGPDGTPVRGAAVSLSMVGSSQSGPAALTDSNGRFTIANVPQGRYIVKARVSAFTMRVAAGAPLTDLSPGVTTSTHWAQALTDVANGNGPDVRMTLRPAFSLSGVIRFSGTAALPVTRSAISVLLTDVDGTAQLTGQVDATGAFGINGIVPGRYQLKARTLGSSMSAWLPASAVAAGIDLLDASVDFGEMSTDLTGVVLTFSDKHTEVSGVVQTADGGPATSFIVVAFPSARALWASQRRVLTARPSTSGKYTLQNLPAGDYLVAVVPSGSQDLRFGPAQLELLVQAAIRISLAEGERKTQDLRIAR